MTGDQQDFLLRLKSALPAAWWNDETPVLDGVLSGWAFAWAWLFGLLQQMKSQTRIRTASGSWLDLVALDFFGNRLRRMEGESDAALRSRIQIEMQRVRATREALIDRLTDLTGVGPKILEPARPADVGGWGVGLGWGAGSWGSLGMPYECLITVPRGETGVADDQIYTAIADVLPSGAIAWTQLVG